MADTAVSCHINYFHTFLKIKINLKNDTIYIFYLFIFFSIRWLQYEIIFCEHNKRYTYKIGSNFWHHWYVALELKKKKKFSNDYTKKKNLAGIRATPLDLHSSSCNNRNGTKFVINTVIVFTDNSPFHLTSLLVNYHILH